MCLVLNKLGLEGVLVDVEGVNGGPDVLTCGEERGVVVCLLTKSGVTTLISILTILYIWVDAAHRLIR